MRCKDKFPILKLDVAHVWLVEVPNFIPQLDDFWEILADDEKERAERFVFAKHKEIYIIVHGILRQLLARYLQIKPQEINFINNNYGKPEVANIHFNISHSHDMALLGFTKNSPIGIDIEFMRKNFASLNIARRFFSEHEIKALSQAKNRTHAFFNCWTRKEAFIKAIGHGLSFPLNKFDVAIGTKKDSLLLDVRDNKYKVSDWSLTSINIPNNYQGALAVFSSINKIYQFSY
jgi:4'-phosphopantetheinyl transferase